MLVGQTKFLLNQAMDILLDSKIQKTTLMNIIIILTTVVMLVYMLSIGLKELLVAFLAQLFAMKTIGKLKINSVVYYRHAVYTNENL